MRILGLDASSSYVGVAVIERAPADPGPGQLLFLDAVPGSNKEPWELADRVVERLGAMGDVDALKYEVPPPSVPEDVRHGFQAPIGLAIGLTAGCIIGRLHGRARAIQGVPVKDWWTAWELVALRSQGQRFLWENWRRTHKETLSTFDRIIRMEGKVGAYATYRGCTHAVPVHVGGAPIPKTCPACAGDSRDPAEIRRDERKRWSVESVRAIYPDFVDTLIAGARSRARSDKPDHQLSGVHDACEAVAIAHT